MQSQVDHQSGPPPEHYTVAIICSLGCQLNAICSMFDTHFETPLIDQTHDSNTYTCGCINKHYVVVVSKGLYEAGPVPTSVQIGPLRNSFRQLQSIIVFGTAGGIPSQSPKSDPMEDIRLGDVVVGWAGPEKPSVVQWDSGTSGSDGFKTISLLNLPSQRFRKAIGKLQAKRDKLGDAMFRENLKRCIADNPRNFYRPKSETDRLFNSQYDHPAGNSSCKNCDSSKSVVRLKRNDATKVKIHYGTIASGSSVITSATVRDSVRDRTGALCVEMSVAGVAAWEGTDPLAIKGISDYADSHKTGDMAPWRSYAAATAAAYVRELLYAMDPGLLPGMNSKLPFTSQYFVILATIIVAFYGYFLVYTCRRVLEDQDGVRWSKIIYFTGELLTVYLMEWGITIWFVPKDKGVVIFFDTLYIITVMVLLIGFLPSGGPACANQDSSPLCRDLANLTSLVGFSMVFALVHMIWFFVLLFFFDGTLQDPGRPTAEKAGSAGEAPVADTKKSTPKDAMNSIVQNKQKPTAKAASKPKNRRR